MKTEEIALSRVVENEENPRTITTEKFQKLVKSLLVCVGLAYENATDARFVKNNYIMRTEWNEERLKDIARRSGVSQTRNRSGNGILHRAE